MVWINASVSKLNDSRCSFFLVEEKKKQNRLTLSPVPVATLVRTGAKQNLSRLLIQTWANTCYIKTARPCFRRLKQNIYVYEFCSAKITNWWFSADKFICLKIAPSAEKYVRPFVKGVLRTLFKRDATAYFAVECWISDCSGIAADKEAGAVWRRYGFAKRAWKMYRQP